MEEISPPGQRDNVQIEQFTSVSLFGIVLECPRGGGLLYMDKPNVPKLPTVAPTKFFSEVASELKKVTWPTRQETVKLTVAVIVISVAVGLFVGGLDILFVRISTMMFK